MEFTEIKQAVIARMRLNLLDNKIIIKLEVIEDQKYFNTYILDRKDYFVENDIMVLKLIGCIINNKAQLVEVPEGIVDFDWFVRRNKWNISYIKDYHLNEEVMKVYFKCYPDGIVNIPSDLLNPELCKLAVDSNCYAIEHIPESFLSEEIYLLAVNKGYRHINRLFRSCMVNFCIKKLCDLIFQLDEKEIYNIPWDYQTNEMIMQSLQKDGMNLRDVKRSIQTWQMCKIAIKQNQKAIEYVDKWYYVAWLKVLIKLNLL
jgi:hypothetical protein